MIAITIMKPEMMELLKDLAAVLEKHQGGLSYTNRDDGIHVHLGEDCKTNVCIGWPMCGNVTELRQIIKADAESCDA